MNVKWMKALGKLERKLMARVRGVVRRAVIGRVDAEAGTQTLQAKTLADDVRDEVELFEPYGFTSSPPDGCEALVFSVGADSSHRVALAAGDRTRRLAVDAGEVAVYHESGSRLIMRTDGSIEVYPAEGQVVRLGAEGGLPVARATDPVHRELAMQQWMTAVEAGITTMAGLFNAGPGPMLAAPGTITPAQIPVAIAEPFARINAGGQGSEST